MATETLGGPDYTEERLTMVNQLLDQIEQPSRAFIENNGIGGMLINEQNPWGNSNGEAELHVGGVEDYKFNKKPITGDGWPAKSIAWRGEDNRYYHLEIYPEKDLNLVMWSVVSLDLNSLSEKASFQQFEPINLPMPEADFTQLLQTRYDLLCDEAAKLKPR